MNEFKKGDIVERLPGYREAYGGPFSGTQGVVINIDSRGFIRVNFDGYHSNWGCKPYTIKRIGESDGYQKAVL